MTGSTTPVFAMRLDVPIRLGCIPHDRAKRLEFMNLGGFKSYPTAISGDESVTLRP